MLHKRLIHTEKQFSIIKKNFLELSSFLNLSCNLEPVNLPILLILTTQRTGSTVLCQDIEQACDLSYTPTESFVPPLKYLFNNYPNHNLNKFQNNFNKAFLYPLKGPIYVHKLMIDYVGWIGFFYAPKSFTTNATYLDLSIWAIEFILSKSKNNLPLLFLDRTDKLAQASSRLINSMGMKTHLVNDQEKIEFNDLISTKLKALPHPEGMLIDQLSIIIKQNDILDKLYNILSLKYNSIKINYEKDICNSSYKYLYELLPKKLCETKNISRKLKKTSNQFSNELINSTKKILG